MMTGSNRDILDAAKATRRERLAGMAMAGLLANPNMASLPVADAITFADALIAELDKGKGDD